MKRNEGKRGHSVHEDHHRPETRISADWMSAEQHPPPDAPQQDAVLLSSFSREPPPPLGRADRLQHHEQLRGNTAERQEESTASKHPLSAASRAFLMKEYIVSGEALSLQGLKEEFMYKLLLTTPVYIQSVLANITTQKTGLNKSSSRTNRPSQWAEPKQQSTTGKHNKSWERETSGATAPE
ncbi:unnamed protein product [Arctogadus glacialis]